MAEIMAMEYGMQPLDVNTSSSEMFSAPNQSNLTVIQRGPAVNYGMQQQQQYQQRRPFRHTHNNQLLHSLPEDFDGKRLRKSNMRKTVDYNCSISRALQTRIWQRDFRDRHALQPDVLYLPEFMPPPSYIDNPINAVTTRFVKTATNKMRCPIFCMAWTPEGRRLVTGASSGEFTLWNGLTFNFETILQAHDSPVRTMVWSHNDCWMITGDHSGYCKYWQSNMNNVKMFQAHKEAMRGLSFSPTDQKMVSCSDDGTLRIWDFATCQEERVLRGHGADVKCCGWHPQLGLIASGSKDNQQPIKLWDPKSGNCLSTLHAHKSTVMDLKWNRNGNWFMTASRDHFLKLFDIRNLGETVQTFRGHKKEASCLSWHPFHEGLIASGGSDGSIFFWHVGADKEVGSIDGAHESIVWTLDWHPLGHILCSGSNDHTSKFWTRNRPGDKMRDRYNLNLAGPGQLAEETETSESSLIPGMAPEDKVVEHSTSTNLSSNSSTTDIFSSASRDAKIPGLLEDEAGQNSGQKMTVKVKRQPFSKPIPKNFAAKWNETGAYSLEDEENEEEEALEGYGTESVLDPINQLLERLLETTPGVKRLDEIDPNGLVAYGTIIPVKRNSILYKKILRGRDELLQYLSCGKEQQLRSVPGFAEVCDSADLNDSDVDESVDCKTPTLEDMGVPRLNLESYLKPIVIPEEVHEESNADVEMRTDKSEEQDMEERLSYSTDYRSSSCNNRDDQNSDENYDEDNYDDNMDDDNNDQEENGYRSRGHQSNYRSGFQGKQQQQRSTNYISPWAHQNADNNYSNDVGRTESNFSRSNFYDRGGYNEGDRRGGNFNENRGDNFNDRDWRGGNFNEGRGDSFNDRDWRGNFNEGNRGGNFNDRGNFNDGGRGGNFNDGGRGSNFNDRFNDGGVWLNNNFNDGGRGRNNYNNDNGRSRFGNSINEGSDRRNWDDSYDRDDNKRGRGGFSRRGRSRGGGGGSGGGGGGRGWNRGRFSN